MSLIGTPVPRLRCTGRTRVKELISAEITEKIGHIKCINITVTVNIAIAGNCIATDIKELVSAEINQECIDI